ncbi:hypothetical protein HRR80_008671 [Exophiala dermatitidis]|uniref:Uncharacterized protein n=1 Tax=Exophiala dermatitidis TaxID=5970 RepID=A0AAN6IR26_EXODE|nr:hypothetical protein HRR82_008322 [Exophiala dermatitidis]KAJ4570741.1 hypothetical protein HRR79_003680 [Exophiala dermatitidis]KAJ4616518.1 hypothetical protein HRR85_003361 [Exophiala dermatitidis]KAJ8987298.1 hypothetical protein HRR80_008671 [Exophiala dermatitidis]
MCIITMTMNATRHQHRFGGGPDNILRTTRLQPALSFEVLSFYLSTSDSQSPLPCIHPAVAPSDTATQPLCYTNTNLNLNAGYYRHRSLFPSSLTSFTSAFIKSSLSCPLIYFSR